MEKITLEHQQGKMLLQKFQMFAELYIMDPSTVEDFMKFLSSPKSISPHFQPVTPIEEQEEHHEMEVAMADI